MAKPRHKPAEANDGSYGGIVLAAFDALVIGDTCQSCDGTGHVCLCCKSAITDCLCGPDAEPCSCDRCDGTGATNEAVDA